MPFVQTVITAAGDSRRAFAEAGFKAPKSLVEIDGKPVLTRAIESYVMNSQHAFVALNLEEDSEFDIQRIVKAALPGCQIHLVNSGVKGSLISALFALEHVDLTAPLLIAGGDSEVRNGINSEVQHFVSSEVDAATIVFEGNGDRWSYVDLDSGLRVREISEKYQIGALATTGVFYFRKASDFLDAARWVLMNNALIAERFFVSSAMNYLVASGRKVGVSQIDEASYQSWSRVSDFREISR